MPNVAEERTILDRLAHVHKDWRNHRPPPAPPKQLDAVLTEAMLKLENPEPPDIEVIRLVAEDPMRAAIWSQLTVVGWRLYAQGGVEVMREVHRRLERTQHPGFVEAVSTAWRNIGWTGDPRGVWNGLDLP